MIMLNGSPYVQARKWKWTHTSFEQEIRDETQVRNWTKNDMFFSNSPDRKKQQPSTITKNINTDSVTIVEKHCNCKIGTKRVPFWREKLVKQRSNPTWTRHPVCYRVYAFSKPENKDAAKKREINRTRRHLQKSNMGQNGLIPFLRTKNLWRVNGDGKTSLKAVYEGKVVRQK